jgi:hypothetical protein
MANGNVSEPPIRKEGVAFMLFGRKRRKPIAIVVGAGLLALSAPLAMRAGANTIVSGPVTLSAVGAVTTGSPYSSGQAIDIAVAPNSTLSLEGLGATKEPVMKAEECADPGGLAANLPTSPGNGHCDPVTVLQTSAVNTDGSFELNGYTIYALPDNPTFGEPPSSTPVCGVGSNECVLYLGPAPNDFSKPHLFSAPFSVLANDDDGGENPGDGSAQSAQAITFTSTPANPAVVAGTYTPMATGGGSGNPVVFSVDGTSTSGACSISAGTVDFSGPGTCVVDANQAGTSQYEAAPQVSQSTSVEASQTIRFTSTPPNPAHVGGTYSPAAIGGASGNPVVFSVGGTSGACSLSAGVVHLTGSGTCVVDVNQAGTSQYQAAPQGTQSFTITAVGPGFTSANHDTVTVGRAFIFNVTTSGSPAPKVRERGKLPKGVKFNKSTHQLAGTLTSTKHRSGAGTYHVTFTATFGKGKKRLVVTQTFSLFAVA